MIKSARYINHTHSASTPGRSSRSPNAIKRGYAEFTDELDGGVSARSNFSGIIQFVKFPTHRKKIIRETSIHSSAGLSKPNSTNTKASTNQPNFEITVKNVQNLVGDGHENAQIETKVEGGNQYQKELMMLDGLEKQTTMDQLTRPR